jgi:soluble lytic murein transglycosylase-like protein
LGSSLSFRRFFSACLLLTVSAIMAPAAWAGERVTLRNGFEMSCDHHAQVGEHTRLFLSGGEDEYVEFASVEIAAYEQLPDSQALTQSTVSSGMQVSLKPHFMAGQDADLSPADLREMLTQTSNEHNLDVDLLISLVKAESCGNARAVSRAGARGLMQLMPLTAYDLGVRDSFNPKQNLFGGSTYLNAMLLRYHDNLALALAAYNAGPAAVDRYRGVPPYRETRAYVARVIHEFNRRVVARKIQARQTVASAPQGAISR